MGWGVGCMDVQCCTFNKMFKYGRLDIFHISSEFHFLDDMFTNFGFRLASSSCYQKTTSYHGVLIGRRQVSYVVVLFILCWHLDQVDGVDIKRIQRLVVAISGKL